MAPPALGPKVFNTGSLRHKTDPDGKPHGKGSRDGKKDTEIDAG